MKTQLFRLTLVLAAFMLTACPHPESIEPVGPESAESNLPWNRPSPGEGAGALQQAVNPY